jgi:DNA-binding NarL/FixJ family response regulator
MTMADPRELIRQLAPTHGGTTVYIPKGRPTAPTEQIRALRAKGYSVSQVARMLGVCERTVYNHS